MRIILVALIMGLSLSNLFADKVKLQNGAVVDGIVKEEGEKIIVETGLGVVKFDRKDVETIEKGKSKLEEYYEKFDDIKNSKNADDFYKLAKWAKDNALPKFVRNLYEKTIELNPDHEGARRALGFQLYQGKWMTQDEFMTAKGFIKFRDKWMTEAEKELIIAQEKEKEVVERAKNELKQSEIAQAKEKESKEKRSYYESNYNPWQMPDYYPYYHHGVYNYCPTYTYFPDTYGIVLPLGYSSMVYPAIGYSTIYTVPQYNFLLNVTIHKKRK